MMGGHADMKNFVYHNFDLLIEPAAAGYRVRVIGSPAGEGEADFAAPFTDGELAGFPLAAPPLAAAYDLGGRLHTAVFAGPVRDLWQRSLQAAQGAGSGLRLRLRLAAAPETAAWPWEYLFEAATREFTALSARTPVVRYLNLPAAAPAVAAAPPLGMLVALAQPAGYVPLDVEAEWRELQAMLAPLGEQLTVARLLPPTLSALQRHLRRQACHILHFVGHGGVDAATGGGVTVWEDEGGRGHAVPAAILATLLRDARETPRLVVLNACAGAGSSPGDPFGGTAQALVQAGIPAVIAFQAAMTDQTALICAVELYGALADGLPVDAAVTEARKAVYARMGSMAWGNLLLFMRSPDGRLFEMPGVAGPAGTPDHQQPGDPDERPVAHTEGSIIGRDLDNRGGIFVGRDYKTGA